MRPFAVAIWSLCVAARLNGGEVRFVSSLTIRDVTRPVTVAAGDLNGDSKLDLVTAGGSSGIDVLLQDPSDKTVWRRSSLSVGLGLFQVRVADLDGDGYGEILAADPATTAYVFRNNHGSFERPEPLTEARNSRWITLGDWNKDGYLDLASANFDGNNVSVFLGDGKGGLALIKNYDSSEPHAVEGVDYNGDGDLDLVVGHGDHGLQAFRGKGDGTFMGRDPVSGFPACARFVFTADFNHDGKGDLVLTCLQDSPQGWIAHALAGTSNGDGSFRSTLDLITDDIATAATADLNGDGNQDLAIVTIQSRVLAIYPGKGDGTFLPEVSFGPTGEAPSFVIAADLDGDGHNDVVTADTGSSTLTVFWGRAGEQFLEAGKLTKGYTGSASAVADLDGDGFADFFFARSSPPRVDVFLKAGFQSSGGPSLSIPTAAAYNYLTVTDLNGDTTPDLAGVTLASGMLNVAFLNASGIVLNQLSMPVGGLPSAVTVGRIDSDATVDIAVPETVSRSIVLFWNQGGGAFTAAPAVPTLDRPRTLLLGDADLDGLTDLIVTAPGLIAIHYGKGNRAFTEPVVVLRSDPPRAYRDLAIADVSGDLLPDLLVAPPGAAEILVLTGKGNREFDGPASVKLSSGPRSIFLADLDGDGLLDITTTNSDKTVAVIFNRGKGGLEAPANVRGAFPQALDHLVMDLNQDGVLDLTIFAVGTTYIFDGLALEAPPSGSFRRGDADANGKVEVTDAVKLLRYLFRGAESPCESASDADDDGHLCLTDAVVILRWLFQAGPPPSAPGPELCGEDPTPDFLRGCLEQCR